MKNWLHWSTDSVRMRRTRATKLSATNPRVPIIMTSVPFVTEVSPSRAPDDASATIDPNSSGVSEGKRMPAVAVEPLYLATLSGPR